MLRFCIHAASACFRLGNAWLRRLQCSFSFIADKSDSESLNILVSEVLSATNHIPRAILIKSMIPFYLMTRVPMRYSELHAVFILPPNLAQSIQDCTPSSLGPSFFVTLVSAAHSSKLQLDDACLTLVEIFNCIIAHALAVAQEDCGSGNSCSAPSYSDASISAITQLQPARILSAARAALSAIMLFNRILGPLMTENSSETWLAGLAERAGVEHVCVYLERSGVITSLIRAVTNNDDHAGFKRVRDEVYDGSSDITVWKRVALVCKGFTGSSASDAEWL
jgi:hypothetical protein